MDWLEGARQIGKVHDPAGALLDRSGNMNFDMERMPVQAPALMTVRDIGQKVCRLDSEDFEYFHGTIRQNM